MSKLLHATRALCPTCLRALPAEVCVGDAGEVRMARTCPEHGSFNTRIWPNAEHYEWLREHALPAEPPRPEGTFPPKGPCPHGCGTCTQHARHATLLEIEVTRNCNLHCPVCFASAENSEDDPSMDEIDAMCATIARDAGASGAVQVTGGEPTCRADLPDIVRRIRSWGFPGVEINTNGLVIASRPGYVEQLAEAGITGIYLSFDGLTGDVYEVTCGRDILAQKRAAIERCREAGVQVVLSVAVMAGVNDMQLGDLLRFSLDNSDVVAGLALQPAFASGRFDARDYDASRDDALTMGDVIFKLAEQSEGLLDVHDVWPLGCSHPLCDTGVFLVHGQPPAGTAAHPSGFYPATRAISFDDYRAALRPDSPQGSVFADILAARGIPVREGLSVIVMNYMDAASMDLERMRECSMMVAIPDGRCIPFCSYHLTNAAGARIYPPWGR